jgi:hypothetical protein
MPSESGVEEQQVIEVTERTDPERSPTALLAKRNKNFK